MATQSLYRRYRPRRFSELKGQDHIVRALRTSVAEGREGQAYLFSGPRGTGKTTSARILAKVLNCENPSNGEPCCECASCLSVEQGTSYDVHELDAASNNGVEAMRDLIEKASLGTPGRHKVYILDEVHMLSKAAEAALLKTLEEPPPHVVFVLATTDPQKMSDTIRSRTQHLQFHLLPADTLHEHVKWVAADAGLVVTDDAIDQVLAQGAGSARDTLSALELVANSGGDAVETIGIDAFVDAMIENDPGRALTVAAQAISRGRDPRTLSEELIAFLRNGFLALMAPDLVQLPSQRLDELTEQARRLGPAGLVRGIEHLGAALTEMRHAPDPRVLLDVAIVQLTSEQLGGDMAAVLTRLEKLERQVASGGAPAAASVSPAASPVSAPDQAAVTAPPADPATGRAPLGGRAARAAAADGADKPGPTPPEPAGSSRATAPPENAPQVAAAPSAGSPDAVPAAAATVSNGQIGPADWDAVKSGLRGMTRAVFAPAEFVSATATSLTLSLPNDAHRAKCAQHTDAIERALTARVGSATKVQLVVGGAAPPSDEGGSAGPGDSGGETPSGGGSSEVRPVSEARTDASGAAGETAAGSTDGRGDGPSGEADPASVDVSHPTDVMASVAAVPVASESHEVVANDSASDEPSDTGDDDQSDDNGPDLQAVPDHASGRAIAERARQAGPEPDPDQALVPLTESLPDDHEIDLDDLVDAPPETVKTPIDRLAEAFPGSELVDDIY